MMRRTTLASARAAVWRPRRGSGHAISQQLDELTASVQHNFARIATDIEGVKTDIGWLKTDIEGVKTDIGWLKTDIEGVKTDLARTNTDISRLTTDIEGVKTDIEGVKTDIGWLKTKLCAMDAGSSTEVAGYRAGVLSNGRAHAYGMRATWTIIRVSGTLYAVSAAHCALRYRVGKASEFTPVFMPRAVADVATRLFVPKRQLRANANPRTMRHDVALVELTRAPAGVVPVDVELATVTDEDLHGVAAVIGHAAGADVTGTRPVIGAAPWCNGQAEGCTIFHEWSGEPGNSGAVVVGKRASGPPLVLGVYFGLYHPSGTAKLRARGVVAPLTAPTNADEFVAIPFAACADVQAKTIAVEKGAAVRWCASNDRRVGFLEDKGKLPFLWVKERFHMDGLATSGNLGPAMSGRTHGPERYEARGAAREASGDLACEPCCPERGPQARAAPPAGCGWSVGRAPVRVLGDDAAAAS